jgi:hypothetical protein
MVVSEARVAGIFVEHDVLALELVKAWQNQQLQTRVCDG